MECGRLDCGALEGTQTHSAWPSSDTAARTPQRIHLPIVHTSHSVILRLTSSASRPSREISRRGRAKGAKEGKEERVDSWNVECGMSVKANASRACGGLLRFPSRDAFSTFRAPIIHLPTLHNPPSPPSASRNLRDRPKIRIEQALVGAQCVAVGHRSEVVGDQAHAGTIVIRLREAF